MSDRAYTAKKRALEIFEELELTKHITRHTIDELFSSGAPHIYILPRFCNDSACHLVF